MGQVQAELQGPDYKPFPAQVRVAREGPVRKVTPSKSLRLTEGALDAKPPTSAPSCAPATPRRG